jgi:hypothetical protein
MDLPVALALRKRARGRAKGRVEGAPKKRGSGLRRRNLGELLRHGAGLVTRGVQGGRFGGSTYAVGRLLRPLGCRMTLFILQHPALEVRNIHGGGWLLSLAGRAARATALCRYGS